MDELKEHIKTLAARAAKAEDSGDATRFAQSRDELGKRSGKRLGNTQRVGGGFRLSPFLGRSALPKVEALL